MSDDWLTWSISGVVAGAGVIGAHLGMLYLAERNHERADKEYLRFPGLIKQLRTLEKEIDVEGWCWPIYARPVYYTPIDHDAKLLFSHVQQNLSRALQLKDQTHMPPQRVRSLRSFLALGYNWQLYNTYMTIQENIQEFDKALAQINTHLNTLRNSHEREATLQAETKQSLSALEKQIAETSRKIRKKSQGRKYDQNLNWVQANTNNCLLEAQNQLQKKTSDGINYAIADLYIRTAKYILEHFDLYEKEYAIPVRFELDQFEHHHDEFQKWIGLILAEQITDWRTLHTTAGYRAKVDQQMQRSVLSLKGFLGKQKILNALEKRIQATNFSKIQQEVQDLEKECEKYWRPYDQDPSNWVKVLRTDPLPGIDLDDARRLFQAEIHPATGPDAVIKQSSLVKIILDMNLFIQQIGSAKLNQAKLRDELSNHKAAQLEAEVRLGATGRTFQRIRELAPVESDSSADVQRKCISCRNEFDVFQARARAIQGANFPQMLLELDEFENTCLQVKQQHVEQINALKRQWHELIQQLISLQSDINEYASRKPRIEYDTSEISSNILLAINSYSTDVESYRDLNAFISQTRPVIGGAKKDKIQLENSWKSFKMAENKAEKVLLDMQRVLDEYQQSSTESWAWTQKAYKKAIAAARNSHQKHSRELEQLTKLDIVVKQAIGMCQSIGEDVAADLQSMLAKLEPIRERQEHLQNKLQEIEKSTRRTNMFSMQTKNYDLINQFCVLAVQADNADSAEMNLNWAEKVVERSLPRDEAVRIINNSGVYNEQQNNAAGSATQNAGRDIKSTSAT